MGFPVIIGSSSVGLNGGNVFTCPHAVLVGTELLIVTLPHRQSATVISATYAGQNLTPIAVNSINNKAFYLINPPVGLANIIVTLSTVQSQMVGGGINIQNVDLITPIGASSLSSATFLAAPYPQSRTVNVNTTLNRMLLTSWKTLSPTSATVQIDKGVNETQIYNLIDLSAQLGNLTEWRATLNPTTPTEITFPAINNGTLVTSQVAALSFEVIGSADAPASGGAIEQQDELLLL